VVTDRDTTVLPDRPGGSTVLSTSTSTLAAAVPAQAGGFLGVLGLVVLVLTVVSVYSAAVVVEDGRPEALFVLGELRAVLEPGLQFVPPFVSETYPVDPETETVDLGDRRLDLPAQHREALSAHVRPVDGDTDTDTATDTDADRPSPPGDASDDRR